MAKYVQQFPELKRVSYKPPRWMNAKGELLNRAQYDKEVARLKGLAAHVTLPPTQEIPSATRPKHASTGPVANLPPADDAVPAGTPVARIVAPPPPNLDQAKVQQKVLEQASEIADKAQAALSKGQETLAMQIAGVAAPALSGLAAILLPEKYKWLVVPPENIQGVLNPVARIVARHSAINVDPLSPDGQDAMEALGSLALCGSIMWAQWYEVKQKEMELQEFYARRRNAAESGRGAPAHDLVSREPAVHYQSVPTGVGTGPGQATESIYVGRAEGTAGAGQNNGHREGVELDGADGAAAISQLYAKSSNGHRGPVRL